MPVLMPGIGQGFARHPDASAAPEQWQDLVGAGAPLLGNQGNTVQDHGSFRAHGTLTNGPLWVMSALGPALSFDGTDDYVRLLTAFGNPAHMSVLLWINVRATGATFARVFARSNRFTVEVATTLVPTVTIVDSTLAFRSAVAGGFPLTLGQWTFLAGTYNGSVLRCYIDGIMRGENTSGVGAIEHTLTDTRIGQAANGNNPFNGLISQWRIYNRAWTAAEMSAAAADPTAMYRLRRRQVWAVADLEPPLPPQYARPMSDVFNSGWETHTGATTGLWEQLNEVTADHENFIRTSDDVTFAVYVSKLTQVPLPTTTTGYVMRYTYGKNQAEQQVVNETIQLRQDYVDEDTQGTLIRGIVHEDVGVFPQEAAIPLTPEEIALITDPTNLYKRTVRSTP